MTTPTDATPAGKKRVLFICSGNFYRSRLAEILFNHEAVAAGLPWAAESRGLLQTRELKGLSEHAQQYLKVAGLEHLGTDARNPLPLDVEDLTAFDLIVGLCRSEHRPMVEQKFVALAKALQQSGRLRYWSIYDVPGRPHAILRLLGGGHRRPCQPPDSGTEHIALAVKALVGELLVGEGTSS